MNRIKQIIREEIDDFDWAEDIPAITDFEDLKRGDKIMVISLSEYYYDSVDSCGVDIFTNVGQEYTINGVSATNRIHQDCGMYGKYGFDHSERVITIEFNGWWFNKDMVSLIIV